MKINGIFEFHKAILVNEELLRSLEAELSVFAEEYKYTGYLENGNKVYFDNLKEMLEYDNYNNRKIKSLNLRLSLNFNIDFTESISYISSYKSTTIARYSCNNSNDDIIIQGKLREIFEKNKFPWYYTLLTKITIIYFGIIMLILSFILYLNFGSNSFEGINVIQFFYTSTIASTILYIISYELNKIRNILFPSIVFYWGKEKERFDKNRANVDKVFWGILVASALPLIGKLIFKSN